MSENILKDTNSPDFFQKELDRARKELAILYDVSNAMRTTLELNHVLYIILTGVTSHAGLGFNRAILFLLNKKERVLEGKMVIGPESGEQAGRIWKYIKSENQDLEDLVAAYKISQNTTTPLNEAIKKLKVPLIADGGLLAKAYLTGSPILIGKDTIDQYATDPFLQVFKTNELVVMPLKTKDKVNGLIVADNLFTQKPITADDLKIFTMLANQAGLAIENSQLYEIVVHKSHTDSLTSLWNHGFFQDSLAHEIEKATEHHSTVALAIIDIDDFKKFNDSHGHQVGDLVLTELAKLLKETSREGDYVCRYGGEEFSLILPKINKEQAFIIAERIREKICQYEFPLNIKGSVRLTVSIGLTVFPTDATNKEELIQKADRAMYTAKFIGKNRTCLSELNED